jgi:hypothetical protein
LKNIENPTKLENQHKSKKKQKTKSMKVKAVEIGKKNRTGVSAPSGSREFSSFVHQRILIQMSGFLGTDQWESPALLPASNDPLSLLSACPSRSLLDSTGQLDVPSTKYQGCGKVVAKLDSFSFHFRQRFTYRTTE